MWNSIPICTSEQARLADQKAICDYGIPSLVLMERAALGCVERMQSHIRPNDTGLIVCGPGNNGADGLAIARLLSERGFFVKIVLPDSNQMSSDEKVQLHIVQKLAIEACPLSACSLESLLHSCDYIVDAMFGSGLSRAISGQWYETIAAINASGRPVFSVDIPSGLDGNTGIVQGIAVKATHTFALDCVKWGEISAEGAPYCGRLHRVPIGIPSVLHEKEAKWLSKSSLCQKIPKRSPFQHKGALGRALMIGGSPQMPGAISIASSACFHSGIGLLSVFVPVSIQTILQTRSSLIMTIGAEASKDGFSLAACQQLQPILSRFDVLCIGNGMGKNPSTDALLQTALSSDATVVIDADAIASAGRHPFWLDREAPVILTPHIKEMSDLTGLSMQEIKMHPYKAVSSFCAAHPNCILVLKSCATIIGYRNQLSVLFSPNSALSKGGSGDVLAGILTGLCGWIKDPFLTAQFGVLVHSMAAMKATNPVSFTALDLVQNLDFVFEQFIK